MKSFKVITLLILTIFLNACIISFPAGHSDLEGTSWALIEMNQVSPMEGTRVTLIFNEGSFTGNAGCNTYSSDFAENGEKISFGPIVRTEMACVDIPGVMDQEDLYLAILSEVQNYEIRDDILSIISANSQTLKFQPLSVDVSGSNTPVNEQPSVSQSNPTVTPEPTQLVEIIEPPVGFKKYQDSPTGISIYIPEEWFIQDQSIVEGEYAIFSSYPPDKYVGGGARQPGDTKCDLNLISDLESIDSLVHQWESSNITSIVSMDEMVLNSGKSGVKFVIDSLGLSTVMVTEVADRLVIFTCWGEFDRFDEMAATLKAGD